MLLKDAIKLNQRKQARYKKYERILRRLRQRIFDYEDYDAANDNSHQYDKARYLMTRCQDILAPSWQQQRAAAEDYKLQHTPSAYECGVCRCPSP